MLRIPEKLSQYVGFEEGKIISVNLPKELEEDFEKLKKQYEAMQKNELAEY